MNIISISNNFDGVLSPGDERVGDFESCIDHQEIVVNVKAENDSDEYRLFIQFSKSNALNQNPDELFAREEIRSGIHVKVKASFFRVIIRSSRATSDLTINTMDTNLIGAMGGGGGNGGSVDVNNFPATQTVDGSVSITNFPAQQIDLHTERANGNCFLASNFLPGVSANFFPLPVLYVLFNPVNSGKRIFWYNFFLSRFDADRRDVAQVRMRAISGFSGGISSNIAPTNLKFDSNKTSVVQQFVRAEDNSNNISYIGDTRFLDSFTFEDNGSNVILDFHEEFIEIPAGFGVSIEGRSRSDTDATSGNSIDLTSSFRYIEVDEP